MAHNLIVNYNLYREMDVFRPPLIDHTELTRFHSDDYINFLRTISPDNMADHMRELQRFNVGEDWCVGWGGVVPAWVEGEVLSLTRPAPSPAPCLTGCTSFASCPRRGPSAGRTSSTWGRRTL